MRPALLALAISGCSTLATGTAEVNRPGSARPSASPVNVASVSVIGASLFGVPSEAVTSHATVARIDAERTCFDVMVRLFAGQTTPSTLSVTVDDVPVLSVDASIPVCTDSAPCFPDDSALRDFEAETDPRIRVQGERVCFDGLPPPARELSLSVGSGIGAMHFRFRLRG